VDAQLDHEVHLQLGGGVHWPAWILLVDLRAGPATPSHARKPIFVAEEEICEDSDECVKDCVEAKFQQKASLVHTLLPLILGMHNRFYPALHEVKPRILDALI